MPSSDVDVLVVGAGPVGLTMACELRRHGIDCHIVDADDGPTPPRESRALGIHARTLEVFEHMGLIGPIMLRGRTLHGVNAYDRGRRFARFELDFDGLETPYPFILSLSQGETEQRLIERLAELGGTVEWQMRLTDLVQDERGVTAVVADATGAPWKIRAAWLVGCDGAHSSVRERLGLSFEGAAYPEKFLLADTRLDWDLSPDEAHVLLTPDGLVPAIPLPEPGYWRLIDATGTVETEEPDSVIARFRELLDRAKFNAASIEDVIWASAFRIHRRAVDRLRVGRCFLAGDAAHIHSPVGGQGMNTGIQDAWNLAWKLALVIAEAAPQTLLDSYEAERLPIGESVRRGTHWATRIVTLRNPVARAIRNRLAAWLSRVHSVRRRLTRELSELGVNYRGSPIVAEDWRGSPTGPKAGDRVPDVQLDSGSPDRLFNVLNGTRHTLLLFEGSAGGPDGTIDAIRDLVRQRWAELVVAYRITRTAGTDAGESILDRDGRLHRRFGARLPCVYLIRPDGYVGYRAQPPDPDRFAAAVERVLR